MNMLAKFIYLNFNVSRTLHTTVVNYLKRGTKPDYVKCREGYVPNFREILEKNAGYTAEPLPFHKTGGRDLETGRKICRRGGGLKRIFYLVDRIRIHYNDPPFQEKVIKIVNNYPLHSADLALLAGGIRERWIIATENMKVGDIVTSSGIIPRMPVRAIEGEAHPLGALPVGTLVNSVEMRPGWGACWAMSAGTACQIIRQASITNEPSSDLGPGIQNNIILRLPSKQEVSLNRECIATVGRCSNLTHKDMVVGGPLQKLALGYRPSSGLWHRKDGTHGRKIRALPPVRIYSQTDYQSNFSAIRIRPADVTSANQKPASQDKNIRKPTVISSSYYRNLGPNKINVSRSTPIDRNTLATIAPRKIDLDA